MTELGHLDQHPGFDPEPFTARLTALHESGFELDRTCFYPMGGGQPADRGIATVGEASCEVKDIRKREGVIHQIESVPDEWCVGDEITCEIDALWRNQLCRMHTAQHLFSALADEIWGAETVGNQIGAERTRIDLFFENRDAFDRDHLQDLVNDAIDRDLRVKMDFRAAEVLLDDPLVRINMDRMPPNIDTWRTISIGEIDVCPCAGTHVPSTRHIPAVEITKVKSKGAGRLRVEYVFMNEYGN